MLCLVRIKILLHQRTACFQRSAIHMCTRLGAPRALISRLRETYTANISLLILLIFQKRKEKFMSALAQPTGGVAASAPSSPPPTPGAASHPPPRPHPLTPTFCAHCKAAGAANYCAGCSQQRGRAQSTRLAAQPRSCRPRPRAMQSELLAARPAASRRTLYLALATRRSGPLPPALSPK
jgi:hypothetical protein